nr:leucine--tRNA ligase, cytoplasmic-like [Tanacetum cinerariifolium]
MKQSSSGSKKGSNNKVTKLTIGLVYVNEEYDGWKKECLNILRDKFDSANHKFAPDEEILQALQQSAMGQEGNFKQTLKLCMPLLMFKKDEVMQFERQIGLENVEVLSAADPDAAIKAGSYANLLRESPPTPGLLPIFPDQGSGTDIDVFTSIWLKTYTKRMEVISTAGW